MWKYCSSKGNSEVMELFRVLKAWKYYNHPYDSKAVILGDDSTLKHRYQNLKRRKDKHPDLEIANLQSQGYEVNFIHK